MDTYREHMEHEFGARYDNIRERYADVYEDIKAMEAADAYEQEYFHRVAEAGYPCTIEGAEEYEAAWRRMFEYAQSGAV